MCIFVEISEDEQIEVFFKLGATFKNFLDGYYKQENLPGSPTSVEATTYKTDSAKFKAHFNRTLVHYNLMKFVLKTLGIDETKTFQNDYEGKLQRLLAANKIAEFRYVNASETDGKKQSTAITAKPAGNGLDVTVKSPAPKLGAAAASGEGKEPESYLAVKFSPAGKYVFFHQNMDSGFVASPVATSPDGKPAVNNEVLKQVYDQFGKAGFSEKPAEKKDDQPDITEIARRIDEQLKNPFYQDAKITVRISRYGKPVKDAQKPKPVEQRISIPDAPQPPELLNKVIVSNSDDPNDYEIALDIAIDENGKVSVKHGVSKDYLSEYVDKWKQEAEARGLEVDIEELRQQVLADFVSLETEQSFYKKFIQNVKGLLSDAVAGYVEGVQATQKVAKHVWKEGTINESIWYSEKEEYGQWPQYMHTAPIVGGAVDGVIDEIIGLPMAIKSVYEIATDEQKREAFKEMFTKEGFNQLKEGLKEEVKETINIEDKREHFVGQTVISVAAMFYGFGWITKGGKAGEIIDKTTDGLETVTDPKAFQILDDLKKAERHVDTEKGFKELTEQAGEDFIIESADEVTDIAATEGKKASLDLWKKLRERGQAFNKKVKDLDPNPYLNHEVTIEHPTLKYKSGPKADQPKIFRVDSYTHGSVIVERKATDFDKIKLKTFEGYLQSIKRKYPKGAKIIATDDDIRGLSLEGKIKIEVPKSNETSKRLKEFQDLANSDKYKIEIVFIDE